MIKKHRITELYNVFLYCDKCGKKMKMGKIVFDTYPARYPYQCECGHEVILSDIFPTQIATMELEGVEITQEEWESMKR